MFFEKLLVQLIPVLRVLGIRGHSIRIFFNITLDELDPKLGVIADDLGGILFNQVLRVPLADDHPQRRICRCRTSCSALSTAQRTGLMAA